MDLNHLTIAKAARLIRQGEISPVELVNASLHLLEKIDGQLNSLVTVTAERARAEAKRAEEEIRKSGPRSPMHGIPYCLKDIYETAGILTTAQSRLLANNIPARDCHVQERLHAAGGVLLGKNTTWEFAHGGPSWDVYAPPARNPWNLECTPAGSSSGSAAAIAAGIAPAAMGTDTGGSLRLPAAACGIAGLKPTYGRVSRRGVLPNCFSHDHCGPLAWTVEDLAILLQVVAGFDPGDPSSADVTVPDYLAALTRRVDDLTIGVPRAWISGTLAPSPDTLSAFNESLRVFEDMGAKVKDIELPSLTAFDDTKRLIAMAELFSIYGTELRSQPHMFGANLRYRVMAGALIRAEDYLQATRLRSILTKTVQRKFEEVDLILLPTAEPAGKLEPTPASWLFTRKGYTAAFNVTGNPAISICNGFAASGMPTSLQIVGRLFDEVTVLRAAHAYEQATDWRKRRPTVPSAASAA